uniref:DAZ-associated protein 2 n=1 Tax=Schmidtea mediterranea TaxID=79327 RepID=A0A172RVM7_SCHMD|nr:DAZ-associated protein 2 [Schmidtea mediterranea]
MATDDQGNEIGKLFVGGLHQSTTNETLKSYFSKFGEVVEASVMMDHRTGRSRGFGYVRYLENDGVLKVMSTKHHLEGKEIDPKPCNVNMKGRSRRQLKIFVGGIAPEHNEETLRDFFKQFGNITELTLMKDQSGHRHRGFAFVAFDDEAVVKQLINDHILTIGNKQVEIKPMEPQANRNNNDMANNKRGMGMGSMQGGQWPQWANPNTAGWPASTGWGAWPQAPGGAATATNLWDQGAAGWTGGWGNNMGQNGSSINQHMARGPEMMTSPWDPQMWNPNHLTTSAMQPNQGSNNGWGPMTNGGWDQGHPSNQWNALGGFSMQANSGNDWRSNMSNGMNPSAASLHGQSFAAFKR